MRRPGSRYRRSWPGVHALEMGADGPPGLGAAASIRSTYDRYADDVDYLGGCVRPSEVLTWLTAMPSIDATPPDPSWSARPARAGGASGGRVSGTDRDVARDQRRDADRSHGSVGDDRGRRGSRSSWSAAGRTATVAARCGRRRHRERVGAGRAVAALPAAPGEAGAGDRLTTQRRRWSDRWAKEAANRYDEAAPPRRSRDPRPPLTYPAEELVRWVGFRGRDDLPTTRIRLEGETPGSRRGRRRSSRGQESAGLETPVFARTARRATSPKISGARTAAGVVDDGAAAPGARLPGTPAVELDVSADHHARSSASGSATSCRRGVPLLCVGALDLGPRWHDAPRPIRPGERMRVRVGLRAVGQHVPRPIACDSR